MDTANEWDVIIVGLGVAGVSAAITALDAGKRVLALDRGFGGGASALSGGVVYAGGGTRYQKEAGYDDTPEEMYKYLKMEVGDAVSDSLLRKFCDSSVEMIDWLEAQGCEFSSRMVPYKTSNPVTEFQLYFSGNEAAWPYSESAKPAPRGHRQVASMLAGGSTLMKTLIASAKSKGLVLQELSRVSELIMEGDTVVGVRYRSMSVTGEAADKYRKLQRLLAKGGRMLNWVPPVGRRLNSAIEAIWQQNAVPAEARASAVVLSGGGFSMNRDMREQHASPYRHVLGIGTAGDDGCVINLGVSAGGATSHMHRMTAWRFVTPPSEMIKGVAVNRHGQRFINEDVYGATLGRLMVEQQEGTAYLVMDSKIWEESKRLTPLQSESIQTIMLKYLFSPFGHKRAKTVKGLAKKIGVPAQELEKTVHAYNTGILSGAGDPMHKVPDYCSALSTAPFYAINLSVKNSRFYPASGLTLGGLVVDEDTGAVQRADGSSIDGLYAAGRSAVGISSENYVSGTSLADGVFSGRRAGAHASTRS